MSTATLRNYSSPNPKQAQQQQNETTVALPHGGGALQSPAAVASTAPQQPTQSKLVTSQNKILPNTVLNCSPSQLYLVCLVICLIATQMIMLIATKQVMSVAPLPLLLCEAQFLVSCLSARGLLTVGQGWASFSSSSKATAKSDAEGSASSLETTNTPTNTNHHPHQPKKTSWTFYLPLSLSWTLGFVLFNASATYMSPSYVNLMRCGEPVATVLVGCVVFGKRYPVRVLMTLGPVLGGVWLASPSQTTTTMTASALSWEGILLAGLSNICFCIRPFVLHAMKQKQKPTTTVTHKSKPQSTAPSMVGSNKHSANSVPSQEQDDLHTFLLVTTLAAMVILPGLVWVLEGQRVLQYTASLTDRRFQERRFFVSLLGACLGFFSYQYTQLRVMSLTSPLAFSILTPVIKAVMIVLCSLYFGDALGLRQLAGVLLTTSGGYWFTKTKLATSGAGTHAGSSSSHAAGGRVNNKTIDNGSGHRSHHGPKDASVLPVHRKHVHLL